MNIVKSLAADLGPALAMFLFLRQNKVEQGWATSQNRDKKVIRYELILIQYDMKMTILRKTSFKI
jgi:hypothetical protein